MGITAAALLLTLLAAAVSVLATPAGIVPPSLRFKKGKFKLVIFTDQHYGENAWSTWGPAQDVSSNEVMNVALTKEKPDFIVFLGDQLTGNNLASTNATVYWRSVVAAARARSIPWASVLGNHDAAPFEWPTEWFGPSGIPQPFSIPQSVNYGGIGRRLADVSSTSSRYSLLQYDSQNYLSLTSLGPGSLYPAVGNYHIPVYSSTNQSRPALHLYFIDTGGGSYPEVVTSSQVRWLAATAAAVNPKKDVPEILFMHIPLQVFSKVMPSATSDFGGSIPSPCIGSLNADGPVASITNDWGLLNFLVGRSSMKAVFSGHNHGKDWCCPYSHLWLCFGRHSGYGGYGNYPRGVKVLQITETPFDVSTWVTLQLGSSTIYHGHLK